MEKKFGDLLREYRKRREVTLGQMAERIDVAPSYLSDVELGRRNPFKKETIEKIRVLLSLSNDETDALIDAASTDRGQFEIPIDRLNPVAYEAGAALAREWTSFSSSDYRQLMDLIEQVRKSKKEN